MDVREYRDTDRQRRWELLYEGIHLVLLKDDAPTPWNSQLLAFRDLKLRWVLSPHLPEGDAIVNVWVKNGQLWAGSWSGYSYRVNCGTGELLETLFTK
jgi:hypothetical protein